ncbi:hypothetical protein [Enterovibrio coralii]|nr:hypothetical protein [Enterovibrio coralii]
MRIIAIVLILFSFQLKSEEATIYHFLEFMDQKVKVSGNYFKGIQDSSQFNERNIYLFSEKPISSNVCVNINSADGVYKAELIYKLYNQPSENGLVALPFPTAHFDKLRKFSSSQLAIRAKSVSTTDCNETGIEYIASWSNLNKGENVHIYLRSNARSDVIHIPTIKEHDFKVKCIKLKGNYNIAYDKICTVPKNKLKNSLEIKRKKLSSIPNYQTKINWKQ